MRNKNIIRNIVRIPLVTACILLIPLVLALLFGGADGEGFNWGLEDFVVMGTLIFGTGLAYELLTRKARTVEYRAAVGVALATAFLLVWITVAVGFSPVILMYAGVFLVAFIGTIIAT